MFEDLKLKFILLYDVKPIENSIKENVMNNT